MTRIKASISCCFLWFREDNVSQPTCCPRHRASCLPGSSARRPAPVYGLLAAVLHGSLRRPAGTPVGGRFLVRFVQPHASPADDPTGCDGAHRLPLGRVSVLVARAARPPSSGSARPLHLDVDSGTICLHVRRPLV